MSIDRGNHRLITGHAPFSCFNAKPKCNFSPSSARWMDPQCEDDCCRLCWFVFWGGKKRKPNMVGEFAKMLIRLKQWSEGNFWRPINVQCVTRVGTLFFFGKTPWRASPWIISGQSIQQGVIPLSILYFSISCFALTYIIILYSQWPEVLHLVLSNWN